MPDANSSPGPKIEDHPKNILTVFAFMLSLVVISEKKTEGKDMIFCLFLMESIYMYNNNSV